MTPTETATPALATPTAAPTPSSQSLVLGPVPVRRGDPICLYSNPPLASSDWVLYGPDQQVIGHASFGAGSPVCIPNTQAMAPGYYIAKITGATASGQTVNVTRHILVVP